MMLAVCLACKGTSCLFSFIAFIIYKYQHPAGTDKQAIEDVDVKISPQPITDLQSSHVSLSTNGNGVSNGKQPITYQNYASTSDTGDAIQITSM